MPSRIPAMASIGGYSSGEEDGGFEDINQLLNPTQLQSSTSQVGHSMQMSLNYNNLLMRPDGTVMTKENIEELRERYGYCTTCQGEPVKLFQIKKSKLNPLWKGKGPIEVMHVSHNGVCLKCHPNMDPNRQPRRTSLTTRVMPRGNSADRVTASGRLSEYSRSRSSSPDYGQRLPATKPDHLKLLQPQKIKEPRSSAQVRGRTFSSDPINANNMIGQSRSMSPMRSEESTFPHLTGDNSTAAEKNLGGSMDGMSLNVEPRLLNAVAAAAGVDSAHRILVNNLRSRSSASGKGGRRVIGRASTMDSAKQQKMTGIAASANTTMSSRSMPHPSRHISAGPSARSTFSDPQSYQRNTEAAVTLQQPQAEIDLAPAGVGGAAGRRRASANVTGSKREFRKSQSGLSTDETELSCEESMNSNGVPPMSHGRLQPLKGGYADEHHLSNPLNSIKEKNRGEKSLTSFSVSNSAQNSARSFSSNNSQNSGGNSTGSNPNAFPSPTELQAPQTSDDFSMPDFSGGHSFKTRKPNKKEKKEKRKKDKTKDRLRVLSEEKPNKHTSPPLEAETKQDDWFDFSQDMSSTSKRASWNDGENRHESTGGMQNDWPAQNRQQHNFDFNQNDFLHGEVKSTFDTDFGFDNNAFARNQGSAPGNDVGNDGFQSGLSQSKRHSDQQQRNEIPQNDGFGSAEGDSFFKNESGKSASIKSSLTGKNQDFWNPSDDIVAGAFAEHVPSLPSDEEAPVVKFEIDIEAEDDDGSEFEMPLNDQKLEGHERPQPGQQRRRLSNASSVSRDSLLSKTPSEIMQEDDLYKSVMNLHFSHQFDLTEEDAIGKKEEVEGLLRDIPIESDTGLMVEMVSTTMRANEYIVEVQEVCLKYLWAYSKFNQQHKLEIIQAGLGDDIVLAMKKYKRSVKVQNRGCGCIWSLSVVQANRKQMAKAGAIKCVFRALEEHIRDPSLLETAFGALRTLSPEKEIRDAIQRILGPQRVCRAMALHRSSTSIQRDGCAFLSNMAVNMEKQEVSVVSREEMEAVVRALADHLRTQSVVSSACFALKNFTYEEQNLRSLRQFDDINSLLEDASKYSTKSEIRMDSDEIRERLSILVQEDDALEQIAYSSLLEAMSNPSMTVEQAVLSIRDVLKDYEWSEKLICYGLGSLVSLGRQNNEYLGRVMQFDVLRTVMHAMYKQKASANAQIRGCELIKYLAEQGEGGRSMICDVDGCSIVISACRRHRRNDTVQVPGYAALEVLYKDDRCAKLIDRTGGLESFQKILDEAKLRKGISGNCLAPGAKLDEARPLPQRAL